MAGRPELKARPRFAKTRAALPPRRLVVVAVLSSTPHDVPTAILALGVAAFGVRQRLTDPSACAV